MGNAKATGLMILAGALALLAVVVDFTSRVLSVGSDLLILSVQIAVIYVLWKKATANKT